MCVAIYKPAGVPAPSIETLKKCWDANPDGAGLAWRTDGKYPIHIEKGFMTWDDFERYWTSTNMSSYDDDLFIHFRITTHGGTSEGNTHPFPIVDDDRLLKAVSSSCKYIMMHNGMLPVQPDNAKISDTMMLCKLIARCDISPNVDAFAGLLDGLIGTNKLAFMDANHVKLVGAWQDVDGVMFSNLHWDWSLKKISLFNDACRSSEHRNDTYDVADDYYTVNASMDELDILERDCACPYCGRNVDAFHDYYVCEHCYTIYNIPTTDNEDDDDADYTYGGYSAEGKWYDEEE